MSNRQVGPLAKTLIGAKAMIADPENWCQGRYWEGHKRCAIGALGYSVGNPTPYGSEGFLHNAAHKVYPGRNMVEVNDILGHDAVMRVYDYAIEEALNKGK